MKAHYKTRNGRLIIEAEGETVKALFRAISDIQAVFETDDDTCGACNGTKLRFRVRTVDNNDFYSLFCEDCQSEMSFGQLKKGNGLFAKRKDADGNPLPHRGWKKWSPSLAGPAGESHVTPRSSPPASDAQRRPS